MRSVELSAGTIEYRDTGGDGPVLVFLHGLAMDETVWDEVIAELRVEFRCVAPRLPLGAHRVPLRQDADFSLPGLAGLLAEFLAVAELERVTVVGNDWCGAQLLATASPARVARLVLTPQEAFDNYPPGLPGKAAGIAKLGPVFAALAARMLRVPALRRLPPVFGWMAKRQPDQQTVVRWTAPLLTDARIRANLIAYVRRGTRADMRRYSERLAGFEGPALVVWASEDRVMPREHGPRLAALLPQGRLEWVDDSYVLLPLDQPHRLAALVREFVAQPQRSTPS